MKLRLFLSTFILTALPVMAQQIPTSSYMLSANNVPGNVVPFDITAEGKTFPVIWGMDAAWMNEQNMRKGINHIGADNIDVIRLSFQPAFKLSNGNLTQDHIKNLKERLRLADLVSKSVDCVINCDQEAGIDEWYTKNDKANIQNWCDMIDKSVAYVQRNSKHRLVSVSPFNEPDYGWGQGSRSDMREICKMLRESYPRFDTIRISAGNTLNCDQASSWYNYMKPYVDEGNTHQLAGSFNTYANFFKEVRNDGKMATADELHNVGEAIVGVEYGMQSGIWWGFDAIARGQFCQDSNHGTRLAYAENRGAWTSAAVYRNDSTQAIHAYLGSSERQANTSTYQFVSTDRDVYFDGQGPMREFFIEIPGGTGYQKGQTNAERIINITYGEDVAPSYIEGGKYIIMNRYSKKIVSCEAGSTGSGANVVQRSNKGGNYQIWDIQPVSSRIGGDFSYYTICLSSTGVALDVLNYSMASGGNVIVYKGSNYSSNEQWYLEYAGDGFYYIRNRESNLYLELASNSSSENITVRQGALANTATARKRQQWRILPVDAECELKAPETPTGLSAQALPASVQLEWAANTEEDIAGYMILRKDKDEDYWNTIGRKIQGNRFIDNTCRQGHEYLYKIKAIDKSDNMSEACDSVSAGPSGERTLIAQLQFDDALYDNTANAFHAVILGEENYTTQHKSGEKSLNLSGTNNYIQLPYEVADMAEMTICTWVFWRNSSSAWQRIFDFGNGTNQYMFLSPSNGSQMRFAIKNGGDEQTLSTSRLGSTAWHHVAVTLGKDSVCIYVDGDLKASTTDITIRPSDFHPVMNYIGRSQFSSDPFLKAYIDDLRVYNYALNASELAAVMEDNEPISNGLHTITPTENSEIVGYYDTEGRQLTQPQKGVNIVKMKNGKTKKIIR